MQTITVGTMMHDYATAAGITARGSDPERKLCRALIAAGITGRLELNDATTGSPRQVFANIEEAAKWSMTERDRGGISRQPFREFVGGFEEAG